METGPLQIGGDELNLGHFGTIGLSTTLERHLLFELARIQTYTRPILTYEGTKIKPDMNC